MRKFSITTSTRIEFNYDHPERGVEYRYLLFEVLEYMQIDDEKIGKEPQLFLSGMDMRKYEYRSFPLNRIDLETLKITPVRHR